VEENVCGTNARGILCSTESSIEVVQFSSGYELEAYGEKRMRPQEINRNVNLAFKRFARDNYLSHFQKCKKHLEKRLEWFRKIYPELHEEGAYYLNMLEEMDAVKSRMVYISDRWNCPGRIKFMLEVINRGL
jgi:hypothetical protein